jgi:hypothetical protein
MLTKKKNTIYYNLRDVVQMSIGKCHLFSLLKKPEIKFNALSSFVHVGQIYIDVPLRPVLVHGVVYRESKVIEQKILPEIKNFVIFENTEAEMESMADESGRTTGGQGAANSVDSQQAKTASSEHSIADERGFKVCRSFKHLFMLF